MTNPTYNVIHKTRARGPGDSKIVKNATQIYGGALIGCADADGYADNWAGGTATTRLLGIAKKDVLGDTSATPKPKVELDVSGPILSGMTVGGTPTQAKVGELVYCADGNLETGLTMSATTAPAIGTLEAYNGSASDCDVKIFTPSEFAAANV